MQPANQPTSVINGQLQHKNGQNGELSKSAVKTKQHVRPLWTSDVVDVDDDDNDDDGDYTQSKCT